MASRTPWLRAMASGLPPSARVALPAAICSTPARMAASTTSTPKGASRFWHAWTCPGFTVLLSMTTAPCGKWGAICSMTLRELAGLGRHSTTTRGSAQSCRRALGEVGGDLFDDAQGTGRTWQAQHDDPGIGQVLRPAHRRSAEEGAGLFDAGVVQVGYLRRKVAANALGDGIAHVAKAVDGHRGREGHGVPMGEKGCFARTGAALSGLVGA